MVLIVPTRAEFSQRLDCQRCPQDFLEDFQMWKDFPGPGTWSPKIRADVRGLGREAPPDLGGVLARARDVLPDLGGVLARAQGMYWYPFPGN